MAESFGCPVLLGVSRHLEEQRQGDQAGFLMRFWASLFSLALCLVTHTGDCLAPGQELELYDAQRGSDFLQELP